jgi:amidase
MAEGFRSPAINVPSVDELLELANRHKFGMSRDEVMAVKGCIDAQLKSYEIIESAIEPTLSSKYPTTAGYRPGRAQNPYNAWARITDIRGAATGKLAGKTIAVKDNVQVAGVPLLNGSRFLRGYTPSASATVVERVLNEGAILKGTATCEDLCTSGSSFTSSTDAVLNPYDTKRAAGGSSSGSAVLVATGDVDMAIGADQGGSIRLPSCWCGIVGLKPSFGLVPYTGLLPMTGHLDHCGPMAKTVTDCALLLEVMAGCDGLDCRQPPTITSVKYSGQLTGSVSGVKVGLLKEGFDGCESDVADIVRKAAQSLSKLGVVVEEFSFPIHNLANQVGKTMFTEGQYDTYMHGGLTLLSMKSTQDTEYHDCYFNAMNGAAKTLPVTMKAVLLGSAYVRENYGSHFNSKTLNLVRLVNAAYDELFKRYDFIIMPTIKFKAHLLPTNSESSDELVAKAFCMTGNTFAYNVVGGPAININAGYSSTGVERPLPVGMMIVGKMWDDAGLLQLAYAYEELRDSCSEYKETAAKLTAAFHKP